MIFVCSPRGIYDAAGFLIGSTDTKKIQTFFHECERMASKETIYDDESYRWDLLEVDRPDEVSKAYGNLKVGDAHSVYSKYLRVTPRGSTSTFYVHVGQHDDVASAVVRVYRTINLQRTASNYSRTREFRYYRPDNRHSDAGRLILTRSLNNRAARTLRDVLKEINNTFNTKKLR